MDSEHELEFDDELELQTPRQLRAKKATDVDRNLAQPSSNGIVEQSTVLKLPLKGNTPPIQPTDTPSRLSPSTYARINKYQSRNGTPLKRPPITSNALSEAEAEDEKQIRETKLLTDDNKVEATSGSSPSRHGLNAQHSSPIRGRLSASKPTATPPKYNIRAISVSLSRSSTSKPKTTRILPPVRSPDVQKAAKRSSTPTRAGPIDTESTKDVAESMLPLLRSDRGSVKNHKLHVPDISRAEILERMNDSIQSLIENENKYKEADEDNPSPLPRDLLPVSDESLSESPEKILDEIDMVLNSVRHTSPAGDHGPKRPGEDLSNILGEIESSPRKKRKRSHSEAPASQTYYGDWSDQLWKKLLQLIRLNLMSPEEIIDSPYVLKEFQCANKNEIKQRVNFLIEYDQMESLRPKILPRKGKLRSK